MYFDTHIHSQVSPDSEMDPAEAISTLRRKGLGVIFTEHVDYVTPAEGLDPAAADRPRAAYDFLADLEVYPKTYLPLKSASVRLGLEIGLTAAYAPLNRQTAAGAPWDYIIGSIHFVDGWDLTGDYFKKTPDDPYRRMLVYMREMIEGSPFFDSLAHIDYVSRYSPLPDKEVKYTLYADEYDAVFRALIERDKVIEINTSRFGNTEAEAGLYQVYKRYHVLGGRYVTIGSDGHNLNRIGHHFDRALAMAHEIGLVPIYFTERRRQPCE